MDLKLTFQSEEEIPSDIQDRVQTDEDGSLFLPVVPEPSEEEIETGYRKRHRVTLERHKNKVRDLERKLAKELHRRETQEISKRVAVLCASNRDFVPAAIEDAITNAERLYKVEGDDVRPTDGNLFETIEEWLNSTRASKPHWWQIVLGGASIRPAGDNKPGTISRADAADPAKYRAAKDASPDGKVRVR